MKNGRIFLLTIITVSFVIRSGSLLLDKTSFDKLFKVISGIIIMIIIINFFGTIRLKNDIFFNNDIPEYKDSDFKKIFETNLADTIKNDLHKLNYVNININVKTDFESLIIYVYGIKDDNKANEICKILKNKYCTPNDEVVICE